MDRYGSQPNGSSPRDREFRRSRDDYRPGRSPSPRGGGGGGRGGRGRDRSRDRYDGRRRSPSRSPPGYGRGRYRSPSPRRDTEDDLPLPRRALHEIPDIQVIVVDDLVRFVISPHLEDLVTNLNHLGTSLRGSRQLSTEKACAAMSFCLVLVCQRKQLFDGRSWRAFKLSLNSIGGRLRQARFRSRFSTGEEGRTTSDMKAFCSDRSSSSSTDKPRRICRS